MPERPQQGWEHVSVREHKRWFRWVRFDDRVAGPLYLLMKKPEGEGG